MSTLLTVMNKNEFLEQLRNLTKRRKEVLSGLLQGNDDAQIGKKLDINEATVRKHIQGLCEVFNITSQPGHRRNRRKELKQMFKEFNLTDASITDQTSESTFVGDTDIEKIDISYYSGILPLDSPIYIRRDSTDELCEQILESVKIDSDKLPLIRIRGSQFSGKSSLLIRLNEFAETKLNHVVAFIDLNTDISNPEHFQNLEEFLKEFTKKAITKFKDSTQFPQESIPEIFKIDKNSENPDLVDNWLKENWVENIAPGTNCTNCFEKFLEPIKKPKTLLIDGLERISSTNDESDKTNNSTFEVSFETMLRSWTQTKMTKINRENDVTWCNLVIAYCTGLHESFTSPLQNVGVRISLAELNQKQMSILAHKYGLKWTPVDYEVIALKELLGGQPWLINWALYKISNEKIGIEELKNQVIQSDRNNDPIVNYLSDNVQELQNNSELLNYLKKLIEKREYPEKKIEYPETHDISKLERSGIIKFENNEWQISCELYFQYFKKYFKRDL